MFYSSDNTDAQSVTISEPSSGQQFNKLYLQKFSFQFDFLIHFNLNSWHIS